MLSCADLTAPLTFADLPCFGNSKLSMERSKVEREMVEAMMVEEQMARMNVKQENRTEKQVTSFSTL